MAKERITICLEDMDVSVLMAIYYHQYMPVFGSLKDVHGKRCVELENMTSTPIRTHKCKNYVEGDEYCRCCPQTDYYSCFVERHEKEEV